MQENICVKCVLKKAKALALTAVSRAVMRGDDLEKKSHQLVLVILYE